MILLDFFLVWLFGFYCGSQITLILLAREKRKFMKTIQIPDDYYRETLAEKRP